MRVVSALELHKRSKPYTLGVCVKRIEIPRVSHLSIYLIQKISRPSSQARDFHFYTSDIFVVSLQKSMILPSYYRLLPLGLKKLNSIGFLKLTLTCFTTLVFKHVRVSFR
jgi:hypothetical protein